MNRKDVEARLLSLMGGKSQLQDEINSLEAQLEGRKNDLYGTMGAIKECQFWIEEDNKDKQKEIPNGQ